MELGLAPACIRMLQHCDMKERKTVDELAATAQFASVIWERHLVSQPSRFLASSLFLPLFSHLNVSIQHENGSVHPLPMDLFAEDVAAAAARVFEEGTLFSRRYMVLVLTCVLKNTL